MVEERKVPEGYKLTEVGVIPEEWEVSKWGDVLDGFTSGATPYRAIKSYYKGNVKWVTSGELNYNYIYDTIEHISEEALEKTHLKIHPAGTFLMAITGLEAEGTRGSCGILGSPSTTNQSCLAIYGTEKVTVNYLFYYYLMYGNELAFKYCQGTKQQSYTAKIVKQLPIIYPVNIKEQQAIAEALSDVDNLITSLEKLIDKKQKIKQGTMQELLTGRRRLPGFTGEWEKVGFKDVFIKIPTKNHQINSVDYMDAGDYPVVDQGKKKIIAYSDRKDKLFLCPIEGVIIFGDHTRELKYINFDFILGADGTQILITKDGNSVRYYYYNLLNKEIPNTGYNRHFKYLLEMEFYRPELQEQQAIAQILSDMDAEIEALERKLEKYKAIKQGMMQELLTGRIRLV